MLFSLRPSIPPGVPASSVASGVQTLAILEQQNKDEVLSAGHQKDRVQMVLQVGSAWSVDFEYFCLDKSSDWASRCEERKSTN